MNCPHCGAALTQVGRFRVCPEHGAQEVAESANDAIRPAGAPHELAGLPLPSAILADDLVHERNPFVRLHRLIDGVEIVTRFAAHVLIADVARACGEYPPALRRELALKLERPTLGVWRDLALGAARALASAPKTPFLPALAAFVEGELRAALGGGEGEPTRHMLALRNLVAHRGRLANDEARRLVEAHEPRYWSLLARMRLFSECLLVAPEEGTGALRPVLGGHPDMDEGLKDLPAERGAVLLVRPTAGGVESLSLYPLDLFDAVVQAREGRMEVLAPPALQLYFRFSGKGYVEYTPLAEGGVFAQHAGALLADFRARFPVERWRAELVRRDDAASEPGFLVDDAGEPLFGREDALAALHAALDGADDEVLWLSGRPGIGKSALVAGLASDLRRDGRCFLVAYAFRLGQSGCSVDGFYRSALGQLKGATGGAVMLAATGGDRQRRLLESLRQAAARLGRRVVVVLDGLDEIFRVEPGFAALPFAVRAPGIVWLCAGRDEPPALVQAMREARPVFPDGLPPLGEAATRAYLTAGLERLKYKLFERDRASATGWENRFVSVVARRSQGLPLYLKMVVDDLHEGKWSLSDEERLPEGLNAYFERLLERLRVSDVGSVLTPLFCLLVWAREPVGEGTLRTLLAGHHLGGSPRWSELVAGALASGHPMLDQAPTSDGEIGWTFYHDSFRQYLAGSDAVRESREWAAGRWIEQCRRWAEGEDRYALRHFASHLFEAGAHAELIALLERSPFLEVKLRVLADSFPAVRDIALLTRAHFALGNDGAIVALAFGAQTFRRDGVALALRDLPREQDDRVRAILRQLLGGRAISLRLPGRAGRAAGATLNARRIGMEAAYQRGEAELLALAVRDPDPSARMLLVPYLYRYWQRQPEPGWRLLTRLGEEMVGRLGLPQRRVVEALVGVSIAILMHHFEDPATLARLRALWRSCVGRIMHLRPLLDVALFVLSRNLRWTMRIQAEYNPINLAELKVAYTRQLALHRKGLAALDELERADGVLDRTVAILSDAALPFDVYLMLVGERTLIVNGVRSPAAWFDAFSALRTRGAPWFRQSLLYAGFHVLRRLAEVPDAWIDAYAGLARSMAIEDRATFRTGNGTYSMAPHLAWVEIVLRRRSAPADSGFLPALLEQALAQADLELCRRLLASCAILATVYGNYDAALSALRPMAATGERGLRDSLVQLLADIRFSNEDAVNGFLEAHGTRELRERVQAATPALRSSDVHTWVDEFVVHNLIRDAAFRGHVVEALRRAGEARSVREVFSGSLKWFMDLIVGSEPVGRR